MKSFSFHSMTLHAAPRADCPRPVVLERSLPDLVDSDALDLLVRLGESARALPPPFQRVLEIGKTEEGVTAVLERFTGVTGTAVDRALRDHRRVLPLDVWLGIADRWLAAIAAVPQRDELAWATTWHPSQIGVDVTGALTFSFHEHNHVLGHWPIDARLRPQGMLGPALPATVNPEAGRNRPIVPASHVHTLGTALIMLLTGERPFHGDSEFSRLQSVRDGKPVWHPAHHPQCSTALAEVLHRAIRLDPQDRWPDVTALREAVRSAAGTRPAGVDAIAGAFFGARPDRVDALFRELQEDSAHLPEEWNRGGLQVLEDRLREQLLPLDAFPAHQGPTVPARPGRPAPGEKPARPGWWQRVFGGATSRRGS